MAAEPKVFLDTCAPFAAVQSEPDVAPLILELSEAGSPGGGRGSCGRGRLPGFV
jgi:hypothetical protein